MSSYPAMVDEIVGPIEPETAAEVVELMRVERPTLDGLDKRQFARLAWRAYAALADIQTGEDHEWSLRKAGT
jgi:hypothetical protein